MHSLLVTLCDKNIIINYLPRCLYLGNINHSWGERIQELGYSGSDSSLGPLGHLLNCEKQIMVPGFQTIAHIKTNL